MRTYSLLLPAAAPVEARGSRGALARGIGEGRWRGAVARGGEESW